MDEQQRYRIRDDLKGFFQGELFFDDLSRVLYSTDGSLFQILPLGVAVPRDEEDVCALVRFAAEHRFPLIARGAGTGLAGACLGPGLIVDFSTHFRQIGNVQADRCRVQPGVTLRALRDRLRRVEQRLAAIASGEEVQTIGGFLASGNLTGCGDMVRSLRLVLDNGQAATAQRMSLSAQLGNGTANHLDDIVQALAVLGEQNATCFADLPAGTLRPPGYRLDGLLRDGGVDLPRLLVGSEGTLGLFTEVELETQPLPGGKSLVFLSFASLESALEASLAIVGTGASGCTLLDRRLFSLLKTNPITTPDAAALLPAEAEGLVIVEYEADSPAQAAAAACLLADHTPGAVGAYPIWKVEELRHMENLAAINLPNLLAQKGASQPLPFVNDVTLPREMIGEFVRRSHEILQEYETMTPLHLNTISGHVQMRPFLDLSKPQDLGKLSALSDRIHELTLTLRGSIGSISGVGLARTPWVARQTGRLYPLLRQIKTIFDPKGILNPGKIVDPDPAYSAWPMRTWDEPNRATLPMVLNWSGSDIAVESNQCNGCGHCRLEAAPARMCPVFRADPSEAATPRAKANLLRHLLHLGDPGQFSSDQMRAVADLCVNCKMCAHECPAQVNIPKMMLEAKAANVAAHGLDRSEWFLARLEGFARWGSRFPRFSNWLVRAAGMRWLWHKLFGLTRRRRLPRFAHRTFLRQAKKKSWTQRPARQDRPLVALFVDLFANYFDPQIAEAALLVLEHNGFDVFVPPDQRSSGIESLAQGDAEGARDLARRNFRTLADLAREGIPIVCPEPSSAVMLCQDYLAMFDELDARLIADKAVEFTGFLADLERQGKLRTDFAPLPIKVAHHVPCHIKALGAPTGPALLRLVPDLQITVIDVSCSGMAGTFGLMEKNHEVSLRAGQPMLEQLAKGEATHGSTECSSCRLQMETTGKRTLHPAQYLALAYGLLPEVEQRLAEPVAR